MSTTCRLCRRLDAPLQQDLCTDCARAYAAALEDASWALPGTAPSTTPRTTMRTQDEIVARMKAVGEDDFLGFAREVLLDALDYEHARPFLKEGVTADRWAETKPTLTEEATKAAALKYLEFAWGKAKDHRGISASRSRGISTSRSVDKMTSYCWLLGLDVDRIEAAGYAQYGCPKLKAAAKLLGAAVPTDESLVRMMNGGSCTPGCDEGCGT